MSRSDWYLAAMYLCGLLSLILITSIIRYDDQDDT